MASDNTVRDELEANRRSGGYLDKQDFLDRIGQRREGIYDQKGMKR